MKESYARSANDYRVHTAVAMNVIAHILAHSSITYSELFSMLELCISEANLFDQLVSIAQISIEDIELAGLREGMSAEEERLAAKRFLLPAYTLQDDGDLETAFSRLAYRDSSLS